MKVFGIKGVSSCNLMLTVTSAFDNHYHNYDFGTSLYIPYPKVQIH